MDKKMMQLVAVIDRPRGDGSKKAYWKCVGVAFENQDGSWNLVFDYLPARMGETTLQLRPFDPKKTRAAPPAEP
jgi:hypothetical protein